LTTIFQFLTNPLALTLRFKSQLSLLTLQMLSARPLSIVSGWWGFWGEIAG